MNLTDSVDNFFYSPLSLNLHFVDNFLLGFAEKVRILDATILRSLAEKHQLVADMLHIPHDEFHTIAEIAAEPGGEKEPNELVLAALCQGTLLHYARPGPWMRRPTSYIKNWWTIQFTIKIMVIL